MKPISLFVSLVFCTITATSQQAADTAVQKIGDTAISPLRFYDSLPEKSYTSTNYLYNKKRVKLVAAASIIGYGGTMAALYSAWYSDYPQTRFRTFNDNHEWQQVDKLGHAYSAYIESYASMEMWRWTGVKRKDRILIGGLSGAAYQTIIELLDGFSEGWGWSWGDIGANLVGSGLLVSQELAWNEQRIQLKFSFHKKNYRQPDLLARANELYGSSLPERMLKDYNGQTYWLSANLKSFLPESKLPAWLNVAVGYGADGMFGARTNTAVKDAGDIYFERRDIRRYRQWYLAPDIDLTKIKTNNKLLKVTLGVLNVFKFPLPSAELSQSRLKFNWIHF